MGIYTDVIDSSTIDNCILKEAYFGKLAEFNEIEKYLGYIVDIANTTFGDSLDFKLKKKATETLSKSGYIEKLEELFTKAFNLKKFHLSVYYPITMMGGEGNPYLNNAFTVPSGFNIIKGNLNKVTKTEMLTIGVNIDMMLIYTLKLTPQELMAVILHEIGHNFDASIFSFLALIPVIALQTEVIGNNVDPTKVVGFKLGTLPMFVMKFLSASIGNRTTTAISKFLTELLDKFPQIGTISNIVSLFFNELSGITRNSNAIQLAINVVMGLPTGLGTLMYAANPTNLFGYSKERFADSFATAYGYGKELASFSRKLQLGQRSVISSAAAGIPVLNAFYDLQRVILTYASMIYDPHPVDATRIYTQLTKLKKDLNDPLLTKEIRNDLIKDIERMQSYIDDVILNPEHKDNKQNPLTFITNIIVMKGLKGKIDPRELLSIINRYEI